jgi:hypothetical protein
MRDSAALLAPLYRALVAGSAAESLARRHRVERRSIMSTPEQVLDRLEEDQAQIEEINRRMDKLLDQLEWIIDHLAPLPPGKPARPPVKPAHIRLGGLDETIGETR